MNKQSGVQRLPIIGQIIDGFKVVQSLGQGGMGAVYKVEKQGHVYALKVILDPSQNDFQRFQREAQTLAATRHPNIVPVHSFQPNAIFPYIIFDYIDGGDLSKHLLERDAWSLEDALKILRPLAEALDSIHAQGIIHRDLKPANILIRSRDQNPMLTDFGIAKNQNMETLTHTGEVVGTMAYMAPEQFQGEAVSPQTDQWALSIILYRLMSGNQSPFPGNTLIECAQRVLLKPHIPLHTISGHSPKSLEIIFQKAFAKDPLERYQSCQEFIDQCERVLNRDSEIERQYKAQQASKKRVFKLLTGVLLLIGGIVFALFLREQAWNRSRTTTLQTLTAQLENQKKALPIQFIEHLDADKAPLPCCEEFSSLLTALNSLDAEIAQKDSFTAPFRQAAPLQRQLKKVQSELPPFTLIHQSSVTIKQSTMGKNKGDRALIKATQFFREGQYDLAFQEFTSMPELGPDWTLALLFAKSLSAMKIGKIEEAAKLIRGLGVTPDLPEPLKDLRHKVYLAQSLEQLFHDPWAIDDSSSTLSAAFNLRQRSAEDTAREWSKLCQRRFDELVESKPDRADALYINHRKLTYQFPNLSDLILSKQGLIACLRGAQRVKDLGRILMFSRKLRVLDKSAPIPRQVQFAFDATGSFNVYQCVDSLTASMFTSERTLFDVFEILLEAQRHGVYISILEDSERRQHIARNKSIQARVAEARFDPFLISWRIFTFHSSEDEDFERQAKDLDFVIQHPKTPGFLQAQLLTTRVFLHMTIADLKRKPIPETTLKQCMNDLERASKLPHPRPEFVYLLSFEAPLKGRKTKKEIEPLFSKLLVSMNKYFKSLNKRKQLSTDKQLTRGRPIGVPLARDSNETFKARISYFHEHIAELYYRQERYRRALDSYLKYCDGGVNPKSFERILDCLERTDHTKQTDFDTVAKALRRAAHNPTVSEDSKVKNRQTLIRLKTLREKRKTSSH